MSKLIQLRGQAVELGDGVPEWVHLVPFGTWLGHPSGPFTVGLAGAQSMVAVFESEAIDLVFDWEHQTIHTADNGKPAPAAGWIDQLELRDSGVWGHVREWTPVARGQLERREYRYLSPVLQRRHRDRVTGEIGGARLHSAALTNTPFLHELEPVLNSAHGETMTALLALLGLSADATDEEAVAVVEPMMNDLASACSDLGIETEGKTPSELVAACSARITVLNEHSRLLGIVCSAGELDIDLEAAELPSDAETRLTACASHSGFVSYAEHTKAVAELEAKTVELSDAALLEKAIACGAVTPALRSWATESIKNDRAGFEAWLASAPKVPLQKRQPKVLEPAEDHLTDTEKAVCKSLGLSEAEFIKTRNNQKGA